MTTVAYISDNHTNLSADLGCLKNVVSHMSWHNEHPIINLQFEHGRLQTSVQGLKDIVRQSQEALSRQIADCDVSGSLADLGDSA